jgi:hypothetical protein
VKVIWAVIIEVTALSQMTESKASTSFFSNPDPPYFSQHVHLPAASSDTCRSTPQVAAYNTHEGESCSGKSIRIFVRVKRIKKCSGEEINMYRWINVERKCGLAREGRCRRVAVASQPPIMD